jgi:hypothetical protein
VSVRRRLAFALVAVFAAGALVAYVFWVDPAKRGNEAERTQPILRGLRASEAVHVEVGRGTERLVLGRVPAKPRISQQDGGAPSALRSRATWRALQPPRARIDAEGIRAMLSRLAVATPLRAVSSPALALQLGLDPPRAFVAIRNDAGKTFRLDIGDKDPFGGGLFVRADGQVFVLPEELATTFANAGTTLRERRIFSASLRRAAAVRIERPNAQTSLVRAKDGRWSLDGTAPADEHAVLGLLSALAELRALRFLADGEGPHDLERLGVEPADATLRIDFADDEDDDVQRIALRRTKTGTLLVASLSGGPVAEVPGTLWTSVARDPSDWRSPYAVRFDDARIGAVRFSRRGKLVLLVRGRGGRWQMLAPRPGYARELAVRELLLGLARLKAEAPNEDAAPLARYGLEPAALEIAIDDPQGRRVEALHLGRPNGDRRYAHNARWPGIFEVDTRAIEALPIDERRLLDPP